ncbi:MAG: hypothetical protein QOI10_3884, partial [Solirubrobacterales bacterium]|nr:hypothetical protein [Solirubrobacterales bacterium]
MAHPRAFRQVRVVESVPECVSDQMAGHRVRQSPEELRGRGSGERCGELVRATGSLLDVREHRAAGRRTWVVARECRPVLVGQLRFEWMLGAEYSGPGAVEGPFVETPPDCSADEREWSQALDQPGPVEPSGAAPPTTCDPPDTHGAAAAHAGARHVARSKSTPRDRRRASSRRSCDAPRPANQRRISQPAPRPHPPSAPATAPSPANRHAAARAGDDTSAPGCRSGTRTSRPAMPLPPLVPR